MNLITNHLGIRQKLLIAFLAVVLTVLMISYVAFFLRSQTLLRNEVERSLLANAELASSQLEAQIKGLENSLAQMLSRTQLRLALKAWIGGEKIETTKTISRILNDARNSVDIIENIAVFDVDKHYVAGVRSDIDVSRLDIALLDLAKRRRGYLGVVEPGTPAQRMILGGSLDLEGQSLGVLMVWVDIRSFDTFNTSDQIRAAGLTISVAVKDNAGQLQTILPLRMAGQKPHTQFDPFADHKTTFALTEGVDDTNTKVLAVLSVLRPYDWGFTTTVDRDRLMAPVRAQTDFLLLLASLCLLITVVATLFLSGTMTRPILNMTHVAELIASGDLHRRVERMGRDELGQLARSVNQMADRLIALKNELELRVKQQEVYLMQLNQELFVANDELSRLSTTDALTGLANRREFEAALIREWSRCRRGQHPIALLAFDIDHFKKLNDSQGHAAGDEALKRVAAVLQGFARRPTDTVARTGGEEFLVLLPETTADEAAQFANNLRQKIQEAAIPHPASPVAPGVVTVSVGVAALIPTEQETTYLLALADKALYEAKASGRNCVVTSQDSL